MATCDIRVNRSDRVYRPGEKVEGVVVINSASDFTHAGISVTMEGSVSMQLSAKSVGLFEAFYSSVKPIPLMSEKIAVGADNKKIEAGTDAKQKLFETYHGVFVNVTYFLTVDVGRSGFQKGAGKKLEFLVEQVPTPNQGAGDLTQVPFVVSPDTLEGIDKAERASLPEFKVTGTLNSVNCNIAQPFEGELIVQKSSVPLKAIELQLVRVETCGYAEGLAREATEVQVLQVADGDVSRDLTIPIYMLFPRLFSCPTVANRNFKVEFEMNIVLLFDGNLQITENFPIKLVR